MAIRYIAAWLGGRGAVPIRNLMEDAATAEIARAQLWQWRKFGRTTKEGSAITHQSLKGQIGTISTAIQGEVPGQDELCGRIREAAEILSSLVLSDTFEEFLTLPAYDRLTRELKQPMRLMEFED